jgi:D-inositol-3-phosphate glycosyltransferase
VDTNMFCPGSKNEARSRLGLSKNEFIVLYLGYISATKADLVPFLTPFKEMCTAHGNRKIRWIIAGMEDPPYCESLVRQIRNRNLDRNVTVMKNVPHDDKLNLYRAADVFFSPSDTLQESFGLAVLEAMSSGLPQLVSNWDGYRDIVDDENTGFLLRSTWGPCDEELLYSGWLQSSKYDHLALGQSVAVDIPQWKRSLDLMIREPDRLAKMAQESRNRAVAMFSMQSIRNRHEQLWADLAELRSRSEKDWRSGNHELYDLPKYYECFNHYASTKLSDDDAVALKISLKEAGEIIRHATLIQDMGDLFDEDLFTTICRMLVATPLSMRSLIQNCANPSKHRSRIVRHVLWLIKYGVLSIELSN